MTTTTTKGVILPPSGAHEIVCMKETRNQLSVSKCQVTWGCRWYGDINEPNPRRSRKKWINRPGPPSIRSLHFFFCFFRVRKDYRREWRIKKGALNFVEILWQMARIPHVTCFSFLLLLLLLETVNRHVDELLLTPGIIWQDREGRRNNTIPSLAADRADGAQLGIQSLMSFLLFLFGSCDYWKSQNAVDYTFISSFL